MSVDREELARKARSAIYAASEAELERAKKDRNFAERWLQGAIGFIANLLTILDSIFSCLVSTTIVNHYGYDDKSDIMIGSRYFRDNYFIKNYNYEKLSTLFTYHSLAGQIIFWISRYGNTEKNFRKVHDDIVAIVEFVSNDEFCEAEACLKDSILQYRPHDFF